MTTDKLSHTTWKCKYHIVFAPKYRRQVIYRQIKRDIGKILRQLCDLKKVDILEAEACPDHIHMLVSIPPNLKYKYGNRHFWCRGYYVNTSGADTRAISEYIQKQLAEDQAMEQLTFKEYIDPFTGSKNEAAQK